MASTDAASSNRSSDTKTTIILNSEAGFFNDHTADPAGEAVEILRPWFPDAEIHYISPDRIDERLQLSVANGTGTIIIGGGDGTIHQAANFLMGRDIVMGILPAGTFNFIAKDLHLPLPLREAAEALASGKVTQMDVGEVNGRFFLHNAALGVHPLAVEQRDEYSRKFGLNKAATIFYTLLKAIWHPPRLEGYFYSREKAEFVKSPFVFIGINTYETAPFSFLHRQSLSDGWFSILFAEEFSFSRLFKMAVLTLVKRRLKEVPELKQLQTERLTIRSRKRRLRILLDGEVIKMNPPLSFRIHPRKLRMIIPEDFQTP